MRFLKDKEDEKRTNGMHFFTKTVDVKNNEIKFDNEGHEWKIRSAAKLLCIII